MAPRITHAFKYGGPVTPLDPDSDGVVTVDGPTSDWPTRPSNAQVEMRAMLPGWSRGRVSPLGDQATQRVKGVHRGVGRGRRRRVNALWRYRMKHAVLWTLVVIAVTWVWNNQDRLTAQLVNTLAVSFMFVLLGVLVALSIRRERGDR